MDKDLINKLENEIKKKNNTTEPIQISIKYIIHKKKYMIDIHKN